MPTPRSLSATALETAVACPASWVATYYERGEDEKGIPALLGTACHGAIEDFTRRAHIEKKILPIWSELYALWQMHYQLNIPNESRSKELFNDGEEMLSNWWKRDKFGANPEGLELPQIISLEQKNSYPIQTSAGEIPFNYIYDRCDLIEGTLENPEVVEVVDIKTVRMPIRADDLEHKFQARCYALMAQISYPNAKRIWITFDLLRYGPVSRAFSREENIATWKRIKAIAEELIAIPEDADLSEYEKLNSNCHFCIRKLSCKALRSNAAAGGMASLSSIEEAMRVRLRLASQIKANSALLRDIDKFILSIAEEEEQTEFQYDGIDMQIGVTSRREIDSGRVLEVVGAEIFSLYGGADITLKQVDALLKDERLSDTQRQQINSLFYRKVGNPYIRVKEI